MEGQGNSAAGSATPVGNAAAGDPARAGEWQPPFKLPNVAIHIHLLPSGEVLFWGRRDHPKDSLDVHECTPHIWNPAAGTLDSAFRPTAQPRREDGAKVNLFCSGHAFLSDGRLLVAGGHLADGKGDAQACTFDYRTGAWTPLPRMNNGRWYPTVVTLADGTALVMSGSYEGQNGETPTNEVPQVWTGTEWRSIVNFHGLPLYPRLHVAPSGDVFMSGPLELTQTLDTSGGGSWTPVPGPGGKRAEGLREYAPAVMYDSGKVIYIGGGNDAGTHAPTAAVEMIDLLAGTPGWRFVAPMHHRRRQHNATILPDGSVLVTGGTRGGGGPNSGFNDLTPGQPVHEAELWDPQTEQWTELAAEAVDRCYHSVALLLPDATVLSAGGGEYRPIGDQENPPKDSHRDAQIFRPPYLFRGGSRPSISAAPDQIRYGESFPVRTPDAGEIGQVSLIRLSSVTHSFNMNQRIALLGFSAKQGELTVTAPAGPNFCPPGHYMLFILDKKKVPSVAKILHVGPSASTHAAAAHLAAAAAVTPGQISTVELDEKVRREASGTKVEVGLTSRCPYGLGACWGGAYAALRELPGVQFVRPIANAADSTADVYLHDASIPDPDEWAQRLASVARGAYDFRGIEATVDGKLARRDDGGIGLAVGATGLHVLLRPLSGVAKIQYDRATSSPKPAAARELDAYDRLIAACAANPNQSFRVTGPTRKSGGEWTIYVRMFAAAS